MPGVPRARVVMFTSSATGLFRKWTRRMPSRPRRSGASTTIWRSNRPGRNNAGSRTSGRLVAAIRITPSLDSKPSISDQELIERLLALVVSATQAGTTMASHRVRSHR